MALPLCLAKNAISLNDLSEPGQQVLLRLAFPKLNKHKDILSPHTALPFQAVSLCREGQRAMSGPYQRSRCGDRLAKQSRQ